MIAARHPDKVRLFTVLGILPVRHFFRHARGYTYRNYYDIGGRALRGGLCGVRRHLFHALQLEFCRNLFVESFDAPQGLWPRYLDHIRDSAHAHAYHRLKRDFRLARDLCDRCHTEEIGLKRVDIRLYSDYFVGLFLRDSQRETFVRSVIELQRF